MLHDKLQKEVYTNDWGNTLNRERNIDLLCDLNKTLPFKKDYFDTIILSDVLEHVAEPEQLWDEMYRILKKGGRILMNVPFYYWLHEPPYDYYRYTEYCLRRMAEKRGFHLLLLRSIGGTPEILADIFSKHILHIPIFGKFLSIGIQYVIYVFIKTNLGAKLSNKTSKVFPFGYFLIAEKAA